MCVCGGTGEQTWGAGEGKRALSALLRMTDGAQNWPFLMLMVFMVLPAATRRSVWRQRNAGIWSTSATLLRGAGGGDRAGAREQGRRGGRFRVRGRWGALAARGGLGRWGWRTRRAPPASSRGCR